MIQERNFPTFLKKLTPAPKLWLALGIILAVLLLKNTYFSAQFHRISAHRGKKRAYVAVAHSMLIAIYHILKDGVKYQDLGADYYNQFNKERKINAYLKKLKELGWTEQNAMIVQPA